MKKMKWLAVGLWVISTSVKAENASKPIDMVVHRSPTCSCCGRWVEHMKQNNFNVQEIITEDVQAIKNKHGVTPELASCHTAIVDGYVVEGHVPAQDVAHHVRRRHHGRVPDP